MSVQSFRRTLGLPAALAVVALFGAALGMSPPGARAERPNIILIQTDDQARAAFKGHFRGRNGRRQLIMPNTVRGIVRGGAEFRNYYVATPVCSPSRASLLTGQYPGNSGLLKNNGTHGGWSGWRALPVWEDNVPVTLQRAGYRTSHFGKFLNGYHRGGNRAEHVVPPGWDRWFTVSFERSTPYYGYRVNDDGWLAGPFGHVNYNPRKRRGVDPAACRVHTRRVDGSRCNYLTDLVTRRVVSEIRRNGRKGRPFFMQIDYQAPHGDSAPPRGPTPPTRYAGTASRTRLPRNPAFNERDLSDKPRAVQLAAGRPLTRGPVRRITAYYRRYVETLRGVDDGVGAILRTLRRTGQLDNTYVFYLTDHGLFFGEHRFSDAKFLPYEPSSRVGMAVRGPGIPSRTRVDEVVGNIDVPATVLRVAGTESAHPLDGRPMDRFWLDPEAVTSRPFQISLTGFRGAEQRLENADGATVSAKAPAVSYRGFRVGPYKYIRYWNGEEELYALDRDPYELRNRIADPRFAAVAGYMRDNLAWVYDCAGATCRAELPPWPRPGG